MEPKRPAVRTHLAYGEDGVYGYSAACWIQRRYQTTHKNEMFMLGEAVGGIPAVWRLSLTLEEFNRVFRQCAWGLELRCIFEDGFFVV